MANVFMCSIEEKREEESKLPALYKRYVNDTLALVRVPPAATAFFTTLNDAHPSIHFTMETAINNRLPFIGVKMVVLDNRLEACVHRKRAHKGLLLHYQSHVDIRYKRSILQTIFLNNAGN